MTKNKVTYSIPLRQMWDMYRKWGATRKDKSGDVFYTESRRFALSRPNRLIRQAEILSLNFWYADFKHKFRHIWFEQKELYDFLGEIPLKDLANIKQYLRENGDKEHTQDLDQIPYIKYSIALHIPFEEIGLAYSFALMPDETVALFFVSDDGVGQIHELQYEEAKKGTDESSIGVVRNFRLAVNLLAYMACFPECVKDGVPDTNNATSYRVKDDSVILVTSDKVKETAKGTKRPHFRKGYFKRLTSEFYTHMRGQIIFVSETSVNSQSKTVEMSDDDKKLNDFKN
ncbi:hypothetical protein [Prevotella lacticifex]|nr:hypothetical protein [Prevotella lacticifex]GJG67870.1 hypothetical protein PRLR6025_13390 [Prevotella lacticifex]